MAVRILHIETSGSIMSVALSADTDILAYKEAEEINAHQKFIAVKTKEIFDETGLNAEAIDAVSLSNGPGSFTGLRIGASFVKGLAYAAGKPVITLDSLRVLCCTYKDKITQNRIITVLDARKNNVFYSVFDKDCNQLENSDIHTLTAESFKDILERNTTAFIGSGVAKTQNILKHPNAVFYPDFYPSAKGMILLSLRKYHSGDFADLAYFEPLYIVPFIPTTPKNKVLKNLNGTSN